MLASTILLHILLILASFVELSSSKLEAHLDKHHHHDSMDTQSSKVLNKNEHTGGGSEDHDHAHAKFYKNALKLKRREQLEAVKRVQAIDSTKKRKALVLDLISGMHKVMDKAKQYIEKANYSANDAFPFADVQLKEAVANVVENTAFFCEFSLRFPAIVNKIYWNDYKFRALFDWAYKFSLASQLYDEAAEKLLNLSAQQLNIIPREENFVNPYDRKTMKEEIEREALRQLEESKQKKLELKKLEKLKKKPRKPKLSKTEL